MTLLQTTIYAGAVLGLGAILAAFLRNTVQRLLVQLWHYLIERCTLTIEFSHSDQGFALVRDWLAVQPYANKARRVKMTWDNSSGKFSFVPGPGSHYFWYRGRPMAISYGKKEAANSWDRAIERYEITIFGRDRERLERFVEEISCFRRVEEDRILVYTLGQGQWSWTGKRKRPMDTVYMPDKIKRDVVGYIQRFIDSEAWYRVRGIPWRIGMCFEGPPGTGKTTLATALAGMFERSIYSLNLSTVSSDADLQKAFLAVERDGIVLIEDIDSYNVARKRDENDQAEESPTATPNAEGDPVKNLIAKLDPAAPKKEKSYGVTLSGLLNAIDGVAATEGRILIMTTNHPENLDPALVRAGRVDKRVFIGPLGPAEVQAMFLCFYPEAKCFLPEIDQYAKNRVMTAANWQALFIRYHDSAEHLMEDVVRPTLARDSL
jgi:mitochondrial chaperone BCS1